MATSCCPRSECGNSRFEMREIEPKGSRFKYHAIQCAMCGSVVGVVDFSNTGAQIEGLEEEVKRIKRTVANIDGNIVNLAQALSRR